MTIKKHINRHRLKSLRRDTGFSQSELAERIGVDRTTISAWENGLCTPRAKTIDQLRSLFNDDIDTPNDSPLRSQVLRDEERKKTEDLAKKIKNIAKTFDEGKCYSITEKNEILNTYVFRYERKDGIHHCFREIHGNWTRTYTDAQLIDKVIKEVNE